jgi:hypothetical protein
LSTFPVKKTPLEQAWITNPNYDNLPEDSKVKTQKYLNKFYIHGITTISQIQNPKTKNIFTPKEFQGIYKHVPKLIKEALQQALELFPIQAYTTHLNHPHLDHLTNPHDIHTHNAPHTFTTYTRTTHPNNNQR